MEKKPYVFGVRHLSPAGAYHLRDFLDEVKPKRILVEGPSDFTKLILDLTGPKVKPPVAVMAYTLQSPISSILYPFAVYSPEYQALLWARENECDCRFMDLPSGVFLALQDLKERQEQERLLRIEARRQQAAKEAGETGVRMDAADSLRAQAADNTETADDTSAAHSAGSDAVPEEAAEPEFNVYRELDRICGEDSHETFWEHVLERSDSAAAYQKGAWEFGRQIRELTEQHNAAKLAERAKTAVSTKKMVSTKAARQAKKAAKAGKENTADAAAAFLDVPDGEMWEIAETILREAYMRRQIADAVADGVKPEEIVVVTGAYHVEGLLSDEPPMSDEEIKNLPYLEANQTLMPYSYYRLSARSGYGAGNKAPAYYELVWNSLQRGKPEYTVHAYLSKIAAYQRKNGNPVSSAEVIEAVRLAGALSELHGYHIPALRDLRDAAVTCMGHGSFSEISLAAADTEIGTKIGSLPEGVSQTSIQADFYQKLEELRLTKYKSVTAEELQLDLREKLTVKSKKAAFMDLERSFFLHKLRVLGIQFGTIQAVSQDRATWAERWILRWTPEAEIQIVEAVLKGDTIEQAASFVLKERVEQQGTIAAAANAIEEAFLCGMSSSVRYATRMLQEMAVDAAAVTDIAKTARSLSVVVRYGDIRRLDAAPLLPILSQLFLRACLIFPDSCICDDAAAKEIAKALEAMNEVVLNHDFLDEDRWICVLAEIARRDDLNTRLSGFAAAILLERGQMDSEELGCEVERRLSRGIPAELGAGWFEGLAMKNHYALIARMTLWEKLSDYLDTLDGEEFKRALVFLRRAFADFSSSEKNDIAENLGEIWQVNPQQVSEVLNEELSKEQEEMLLDSLGDFDFDDI